MEENVQDMEKEAHENSDSSVSGEWMSHREDRTYVRRCDNVQYVETIKRHMCASANKERV